MVHLKGLHYMLKCVLTLKKEIIVCGTQFRLHGPIGWITRSFAKICFFNECVFELLLQWINLMQQKMQGEWDGGGDPRHHVDLILSPRDPHDCTQFNLLWLFYTQAFDSLISVKSGGRDEPQNEAENLWWWQFSLSLALRCIKAKKKENKNNTNK